MPKPYLPKSCPPVKSALRRPSKQPSGIAKSVSLSEAYRRVTGKTANADVHGWEFMRKRGMKARVAEIKAENAAKCEMSKEEYRAYLIAAMKTSAGQIGPDHQFCQI
jgi:hypothetical protein